MVYYFRRDKGTRYRPVHKCYRGPARVIAIEPSSNRNATSVVWLSHGGNLIRGAPEHLRYATNVERAAYEGNHSWTDITHDLRRGHGRQYHDLGDPPSPAERQHAEGDPAEEPDPMDWEPSNPPPQPQQAPIPQPRGPPSIKSSSST